MKKNERERKREKHEKSQGSEETLKMRVERCVKNCDGTWSTKIFELSGERDRSTQKLIITSDGKFVRKVRIKIVE